MFFAEHSRLHSENAPLACSRVLPVTHGRRLLKDAFAGLKKNSELMIQRIKIQRASIDSFREIDGL